MVHEIQRDLQGKEKQARFTITKEKMMKVLRKISNWKSPEPDNVQGFWSKNFTKMHAKLLNNVAQCIEEGNVLDWMTKGRTVLIQKDKFKCNVASNYRPTTCLPLVSKLMAGILSEEIYDFLSTEICLPEEQKGCRKNSGGTNDLLFICKMILREVEMKKKNLSIAWIDYKKAYDMVPHSWILEYLEALGIDEGIRKLLENSMKSRELNCLVVAKASEILE